MTRYASTKRFPLPTGVALLWVLLLSAPFVSTASVLADAKRGEEPQCQEACLRHHSEKMGLLSREYMQTSDKREYQDQVEKELRNYSLCLTNCREVLPIK